MHELSIAQNIIEIIQKNIPEPEWARVTTVRLKIGAGAGVVADSLEFSFQSIISDTILRKAHLDIESVPFEIQCYNCGKRSASEAGFTICEKCGGTDTKIISGNEMHISEIEIVELETELK